MITRKQFSRAFRSADEVVIAWLSSNKPTVTWQGRQAKTISEAVFEAIGDIDQFAQTMEVEDNAKELFLALDRFLALYHEWLDDSGINPEETNPAGTDAMWKHWDVVRRLCSETSRPGRQLPLPVKHLTETGVADRQIAIIYGWKTPEGEPDTMKVLRERENPGSEYNPETWVHPVDVRDVQKACEQWKTREVSTRYTTSAPVQRQQPSIEDLLRQGVRSKQIMLIHPGSTQDEIYQLAIEKGLPFDGVVYQSPTTTPAQLQQPPQQSRQQPPQNTPPQSTPPGQATMQQGQVTLPPELYDNDQEKLAYLKTSIADLAGNTLPAIVASLAEDFPSLEVSHVEAIQQENQLASL